MGMVYAEEIEGAVLGACLLERSAQAVVLKSLRAEMFYLTAHRVVFEAINALYARGAAVDMLTVTEELRAQPGGRCGRSVCRGETGGGGGYVGSPGVSLRHPVSVLPEAEAGGGADTGAGGGKRYDV